MQPTTTLRKICSLRKPLRVVRGGQGAGKTYAILFIIINYAFRKSNRDIIIASAELTKMRLTVIKDFVNILRSLDLFDSSRFLGGTM